MSIMDFLGDFGGGFDAVGGGDTLASIMAERRAMDVTNQEQMAYQGLLQKYGVGQGMQGEIPASFFLEAAQMPSIRSQMLTGAQSQAGAMGRQQQQQQFGMNNMSLADQTRMQNQQQQFQQSFDQTGQYQQQNIQQGILDREARQEQAANTLAAEQAKFNRQTGGTGNLPPTDHIYNQQGQLQLQEKSPTWQKQQGIIDSGRGFLDALGAYENYVKSGWNSGADKGKAVQARKDIIVELGKAAEAGALGDQELEFYGSGLPASDWLKNDEKILGALDQIRGKLKNSLSDTFINYPSMRNRNNESMFDQVKDNVNERNEANRKLLLGK